MSSPSVSIVINNYNYERFLAEAIDSALHQTYAAAEVIVVDDGSTDASREVIGGYGDRITPVFKQNEGQASAFNSGFSASRGDVVLFLDADDVLLPSAAGESVRLLAEPKVVKVHWHLFEIDEHGRRTGATIPHQPLPDGDLRDRVIRNGPISYVTPPTSGNAWARTFLEAVMPVQECGDRHGADAYLFTLAPIFGTIRRSAACHSLYRRHATNFTRYKVEWRVQRDLRRYEHHCRILGEYLRRQDVSVDVERWKGPHSPWAWMSSYQRAARQIQALIPPDASFIIVDGDLWGGVDMLAHGHPRPFLERNGAYWGPPADDETAIEELDRLRRAGAAFMVFARPAFWWLEYYAGLRQYVRSHFRCVLEDEDLVIFDLDGTGTRGGKP